MAAEEEVDITVSSCLHMVSAFLAMEPPDVVISLAREFGEGSITESVQSCIWHHCITKADLKWQGPYLKRFLKKLILEIESSGGLVLDELYEQYASYMISLQVILSDGDLSTLANMKINLELNPLSTDDLVHQKKVSEDLGADIIYDPSCLPHLVRVLSLLLKHNIHAEVGAAGRELDSLPADELLRHPLGKGPVAYVASVVRNIDTFNYFLSLAEQAKLVVTDLTGKVGVSKFLPYLRSYQRSTIRIFRIHV
ncbi:hypothetical protein Sango_1409900 [Sesamum angolense]|uniref:Uncharacterized protein n=1 Tax=Sesamum angolense TaxID=2727404 RepID=A0AAE1WU61_9LAMI|nr:hypothetical protein Sango_1409900 [Sesamum angolense]